MPLAYDGDCLHLVPDDLLGFLDRGHEGIAEIVRIEPVRIYDEHDVIAGFGRAAPEECILGDLADDRYVDGIVMAVGMDMASDDGDAELPDAVLHTADDLLADRAVHNGHHIDHREGPSAHGGDIVDVDEDREIARIVRVGLDQGLHYPVGCEEDILVTDIYRCGIFAFGGCNLGEIPGGQEIHDLMDGVFAGDSRIAPDCLCDF